MISKRIYIVLASIAVLIALAATAFVLAVKKTRDNMPAAQTTQNQGEIKLLADEQAVSPEPSVNGNAIWFFTNAGRLFRVNIDGTNLTEYPLPAISGFVKKAVWAKGSGNDFILTASQNGIETKYYYSDAGKKYTILPANIQNFDWLPDGRRIVYIWRSGDNIHQQLNYANADASGYQIVTDSIFWPDFKVKASENGRDVLLIRSLVEEDANKIYKADLETGRIEIVVGEGKNFDALWLSNGQKFIFTQAAGLGQPKLFLYNLATRSQIDLNLNTSLDKVAVDREGKNLYAAVTKADGSDAVYKLDLASLKQEIFFEGDLRVKSLHEASGKLFFVNSKDGKLYLVQK